MKREKCKGKLWRIGMVLFLFLFLYPNTFLESAGVVDSGHNMLEQAAGTDVGATFGKAGVCSFCHLPHSTGSTMYNVAVGDSYSTQFGEVGLLCKRCHGYSTPVGGAPAMTDNISIFGTGASKFNHPLADDNTDRYGTTSLSSSLDGGTVQWRSGWPATARNRQNNQPTPVTTMECSSCHNVHSVTPKTWYDSNGIPAGTGASGEFLRALPFDTSKALGDTTSLTPKQIFCEYCHIGRAQAGWGEYNTVYVYTTDIGTSVANNTYSTHPVGATYKDAAGAALTIDDKHNRIVRDDNKGWNGSIRMDSSIFRAKATSRLSEANIYKGHLGGPYQSSALVGENKRLGYDTGYSGQNATGIIICQTCHVVHSSTAPGQTINYVVPTYKGLMFGDDSTMPDLLVINNNDSTGFNKLCETCHSYRPFLRITSTDANSSDETIHNAHPLRHYKITGGNYNATDNTWTLSNLVTVSCMDTSMPNGATAIDINNRWPTGGGAGVRQVVCLTCHDVHGGKPKTKLLRAMPLCAECHKGPMGRLGISHPVGVNVTLDNPDGGVWPDQAGLVDWTPQEFDAAGNVVKNSVATGINYMTCETCHNWTNGNIHYNVEMLRDVQLEVDSTTIAGGKKQRRTLTTNSLKLAYQHTHPAGASIPSPNASSELCVSCHTTDAFHYDTTGKITNEAGTEIVGTNAGTIANQGANPSPWIREYPVISTDIATLGFSGLKMSAIGSMELNLLSRQGTHATQVHIQTGSDGERAVNPDNGEFIDRATWIYTSRWDSGQTDPYYSVADACDRAGAGTATSAKRSKWGVGGSAGQVNSIICQSCHTPHYAAAGLVEYNTASAGPRPGEASPHSALLLATQAESFMCRACHDNGGRVKHAISKPSNAGYRGRESNAYYLSMETTSAGTTDPRHKLVLTIEDEKARGLSSEAIHLRETTYIVKDDPNNARWEVNAAHGPFPPSNYPRSGGSLSNATAAGLPGTAVVSGGTGAGQSMLVCDSCHAPHAAGTPSGTFCLEGDDATGGGATAAGYMNGAAQPSTCNDFPTCALCHPK